MMRVTGRKGGGHTPVDAKDTLRSIQRAEIVDLLGEGQIGGLVDGLKSVFLDGVPVENADGSRNFAEFGCAMRLGGPADAASNQLLGFDAVSAEVGVGVTVLAAVPVVRTINNPDVSGLRVTIAVPALVEQRNNGDRVGSKFEWAIDVQSAGGGFVQQYRAFVDGKASSAYTTDVKLELAGPPPWDVRVRRITPDSTSVSVQNSFSWASYTALTAVRMQYRNSAAVALTFDAKGFSAVPVRSYDVMGISDWAIPSNYDAMARAYSGTWNGTFTQSWTNNPAWVYYNLVKHPRYGLGEYVTQLPDKWTLYQLSQWCDGQVPNGRGGTEPRYTINAVINTQVEALRLLQDIAALFRGALLYAGGTLGVTWDAPRSPVAPYSPANVVGGTFTYSDGNHSAKKSSCTCWFNDLAQGGKRVPVTWDDPDLVAKYGLRRMEIDPLGITSPSQALRAARWALYTVEHEDHTVAFKVGAQGASGRVGDVFQISDPSETGERLAGRVRAATLNTVTLDAPVNLVAGETYTVWVTQPDPADATKLVAEQRVVAASSGAQTTLTVVMSFSQVPQAQTIWALESTSVVPTLWRYTAIKEARNGDGALEYEVAGVLHYPDKWALIEANQPLNPRPTRRLSDKAPKPQSVTVAEVVHMDGAVPRIRATVSWVYPQAGLRYVVSWRLASKPWTEMPVTSENTVDIDDLQPGLLEVSVVSRTLLGVTSLPERVSITLDGKTDPMPDVTGLAVTVVAAGVRLRWALPAATPEYGATLLRTGAGFDTGTPLFEGRADGYTFVSPAAGTYTVFAKHTDATRTRFSASAASVSFVVASSGSVINKTFAQASAPAGQGETIGDLWFETDDGNRVHRFDGAAWQLLRDRAAVNFDARNDRLGTPPLAATIASDGTAVDHVVNGNASADISFEWAWAGDQSTIDGFQVAVAVGGSNTPYTIGSVPAVETLYTVPAEKRAVFIYGVSPTSYYTLGVRPYRVVDPDVNASGVVYGAWAQSAASGENPYRPASALAFAGNVTGTVGGIAVGDVNRWAAITGPGRPASWATVGKSLGLPFESWVLNGQSLVTLTDGKVGARALRLAGGGGSYPNQGNYTAIDRTKKYRVRFWARPSAGAAGLLYFSLRQFVSDAGVEGPDNGGRSPYKPGGMTRVAHETQFGGANSWGEYSFIWSASDWQAGVAFVQPEFLDNYSGAAGHWDVQDFVFEEVTEVLQAQATASAAADTAALAQGAAANAQIAADSANLLLTAIVANDVLDRGEKPGVVQEWAGISTELAGIVARATAYAIVTERVAYHNAVDALGAYLAGLSPAWSDVSQHTPISRTTFIGKFTDVYSTRQTVLNKIAEVAGTLAQWSGVQDRPADDDILNSRIPISKGTMNSDPGCEYPAAWVLLGGAELGVTDSSSAVGRGLIRFPAGALNSMAFSAETIPVSPTRRYRLTARLLGAAGHDRNMYVTVRMYKADNTEVDGSATGWGGSYAGYVFGGLSTPAWTERGADFGAGTSFGIPANVAYVRVGVWGQYSSGSTSNDQYAQDVRLIEVTDLRTAQAAADAANTALTAIASDNVLSRGEKPRVVLDWTTISDERAGIEAQGTAYGLAAEVSAYNGAITALAAYLDALSPIWSDLSQDTPVTGTTFRGYFGAVYSARQALLNRIAQVAGTRASWSEVYGAGRPADSASADITLVVRGTGLALVGGNGCERAGGGAWDAGAYSLNAFTGGCFVEFVFSGAGTVMAGLNSDPATDDSFASIDYALYAPGNGNLEVYEAGIAVGVVGTHTAGDVLAVVYDGVNVRYMKSGTVLRTVPAAAGQRFYFDSSVHSGGLRKVRIGAASAVTGIGTGQLVINSVTRVFSAGDTFNQSGVNEWGLGMAPRDLLTATYSGAPLQVSGALQCSAVVTPSSGSVAMIEADLLIREDYGGGSGTLVWSARVRFPPALVSSTSRFDFVMPFSFLRTPTAGPHTLSWQLTLNWLNGTGGAVFASSYTINSSVTVGVLENRASD